MKSTYVNAVGLALLCLFASCQKEPTLLPTTHPASAPPHKGFIEVHGTHGAPKSSGLIQTQLGSTLANPYAVANMTAAWNALYPEHAVTKLPVTDHYLRLRLPI